MDKDDKDIEDGTFVKEWCSRIGTVWDENEDQRDEADADIRFCHVPGGMWEGWFDGVGGAYANDTDRVRLEFDITSPYINGFVGEWKQNRTGIYFSPDDDSTDDEDADRLTGIYRADFNDNGGRTATDIAVEECVECGVGHFQMLTEFENPEDPENEKQKVIWKPIYNSYSYVVWDDHARNIDKSDAKWCVVLTPHTDESYDEAFPDAETTSSAFQPYTRAWIDWQDSKDFIVIAELYQIEKNAITVHVYGNLETGKVQAFADDEIDKIKDELKEDGWEFIRERKMEKQTVTKTIFNGVEILEKKKRIPGKYIPIIPMYAHRKYIDGKERYQGLVRKLKDPNRVFNMSVSRVAESSAASPDEIPIFLEEQVKRHQANWADKTNKAYQLVDKVLDGNGNMIATGPVGYVKSTPLDQNTVAAIDMTSRHVQQITGGAPQDTLDPDASGKAINALIKREQKKTHGVTDNINIAFEHSGLVYQSIAEEIYTEPMTKRVMGEDGSPSTVNINAPVFDKESGTFVVGESISGKKFKVSARIGPQYETQREATIETLERVMDMVGNESKYFGALLAMWMKNITGTGLEELKDFNRQEMLKMGLTEPETPEEEKMIQMLQQQIDPQEELTKAASEQQKAEAMNLVASAKQKEADTKKKGAETVKIMSEIAGSMGERRIAQLKSVN